MPADFLARAFRAGQEGCTHPGRVPHWSSTPGVLPKPSENGAQHSVVIANQADKPWLLYPAGLSRFSVPLHLRPLKALRAGGHSIAETARLAGCSESQVKRVMALQRVVNWPGPA